LNIKFILRECNRSVSQYSTDLFP